MTDTSPQPKKRAPLETVKPDNDPSRPRPPQWNEYADACLSEWYGLLARDPEEVEVQQFLELHPAMVPGGCGEIGPGGHHGAHLSALFRQPALRGMGPGYIPDLMWITHSTSLITPILIEIEKPSKRWFRVDGRPTADFTAAHDQLNEWRAWFEADGNAAGFRDAFRLNDLRYRGRSLKPQFVLIYGRQREFQMGGGHQNFDGLRAKRDTQRAENESFMTFDSLRPCYMHSNTMTVSMTTAGPEPFAVSPVFGTDTHTGRISHVLGGDISTALARSSMMSVERQDYLAKRWSHWHNAEPQVGLPRQLGLE